MKLFNTGVLCAGLICGAVLGNVGCMNKDMDHGSTNGMDKDMDHGSMNGMSKNDMMMKGDQMIQKGQDMKNHAMGMSDGQMMDGMSKNDMMMKGDDMMKKGQDMKMKASNMDM